MRIAQEFTLVLLSIVSPVGVLAQHADGTREFKLDGGHVHFRAPSAWPVLSVQDSGATRVVIFHVRNPATDGGADRANVLVSVPRTNSVAAFAAQTDSIFGELFSAKGLLLQDTMPAGDQRFFFWRSSQKQTPYAIYDDFGRRNGVLIQVRMTLPIVTSAPSWNADYSRDCVALLASVEVDGERVFPGWAGYPSLEAFGTPKGP